MPLYWAGRAGRLDRWMEVLKDCLS
ncbi:hypothetical protein E2C01_086793 [Portunus trituberculatus]|uniref:Uncharacterized protein n=1 Tax=Portunus trituberculatus TaxID=210409 RepID=A0A5B7JEF2_PORTR|nr:hypothetical protein [Portunus trituberculatus]